MKFLHLSDLHLGKKLCEFNLIDDQKFAIEQIFQIIRKEKVDFVIIAGDVFDKPVPSISALELFNEILSFLTSNSIPVFIIPGNHDSDFRLSFLSDILNDKKIYLAKPYEGKIQKIDFDRASLYLFPYLIPANVRKYYSNFEISNYNDAFKCVVDNINFDKTRYNIAIAHQFVTGNEDLIFSDSEQKSVGGLDEISYKIFKDFNYTALGHLHCPQHVGDKNIRYGGSLLKYSFSEINQKKSITLVEVSNDNKTVIKTIDIKQKRNLACYRGYINEFLSEQFYSKINRNDFIHFILLDENVIDAKNKLSLIYPNIAVLEFDNYITRQIMKENNIDFSKEKSMIDHFRDFYKIRFEDGLNMEKEKIVIDVIKKLEANNASD